MLKCLTEKSANDNLPERRCKPEHVKKSLILYLAPMVFFRMPH